MFYPQEMVEIEMVVPSKDLAVVTKVLAGQGVFHQVDASNLGSDLQSGSTRIWQEKASAFAGLERKLQGLIQTLGLNDGHPSVVDRDTTVEPNDYVAAIEKIEMEVKVVTDLLNKEEKHLEQLESILLQLEPVAGVDLDISALRNPRYLYSVLGIIPPVKIERLETSLSGIPHVLLILNQDNQRAIVWLGGTRKNADQLERAARSAYLIPLTLPDAYQGTPAEIIANIQRDIGQTQASIISRKNSLSKIGQVQRQDLVTLLWDVRSSRMLTDSILRFGKLRYTYVVVGWVPTHNIEDLIYRLKVASKDAIIEIFPTERTSSEVPVSLSNSKFLRPFQMLVTTYARPLYSELDPTILIAITFPVLYGAMFGDVGQGLLLAALGWLIMSKKVKALKGLTNLGGLITACGVMATIFGFVYGSLFGKEDILPRFYKPLIQPMENIMTILLIAVGAGTILLTFGFLIGIYNAWKLRNWSRVLVDHNGIAGLVLYWSLIFLLVGAYFGKPVLPSSILFITGGIGAFFVAFSEIFKRLIEGHRPLIEESIGTYAIQVFFELFEVFISFLSNTLSYVRVGAFAVAHGYLSSAIFQLAGPGYGIGYWLVVILGTLFIVGFEGLIVGIQTMRLEYYEFFGKFFVGGGMKFEPIKLHSTSDK